MATEQNVKATEKPRSTITDWSVFEQAGVGLRYVQCDAKGPLHPYDNSCHTTIQPRADAMLPHVKAHDGGFFISFKENYGRGQTDIPVGKWNGWKEFEKLGLEIADFRCAVCGHPVKLAARYIQAHNKTHADGNRRNRAGGDYYITLNFNSPEDFEDMVIE